MEDSHSGKSQTDYLENGANGNNEKGDGQLLDASQVDPAVDKRITRKFDKRVVPWLFGMWLLAFLDRYVQPLDTIIAQQAAYS